MDVILVKVQSNNDYKYDKFLVKSCNTINTNELLSNTTILNEKKRIKRRRIKIYVDGFLACYILQEFKISPQYCSHFVNKYINNFDTVTFVMNMPQKQIIDYDWNYKMWILVRERCELDHTLSWLSTLGGAFSALGDYYFNFAEVAGKISYHQWNLALKLNDPSIISRCKLYLSLSLIQRGHYKLAKQIIEKEYHKAKEKELENEELKDTRLIKMCLGIWSKLQYEFNNAHKKNKQKKVLLITK